MDALRDRVDDELLQQALRSHLEVLAEDVHRSRLRVMCDAAGRIIPSTMQSVISGVAEIRRVEDLIGLPESDRWRRADVDKWIKEIGG